MSNHQASWLADKADEDCPCCSGSGVQTVSVHGRVPAEDDERFIPCACVEE